MKLSGSRTLLLLALPLEGSFLPERRLPAPAASAAMHILWTESWVEGRSRLRRRLLQQTWRRPTLRRRAGRADRKPQESSPQRLGPKFLSPQPVSPRRSKHELLAAFLPGPSSSHEPRAQPGQNLATDSHQCLAPES